MAEINEDRLVETIQQLVHDRFGTPNEPKHKGPNNPQLRGFQYLHGHIDDLFDYKSADLVHHTGIRAAFTKVHGYRSVDDQYFMSAFDREMISQGIPAPERQKAKEAVNDIVKELETDLGLSTRAMGDPSLEHGYGFHPNLKEIMAIGGGK